MTPVPLQALHPPLLGIKKYIITTNYYCVIKKRLSGLICQIRFFLIACFNIICYILKGNITIYNTTPTVLCSFGLSHICEVIGNLCTVLCKSYKIMFLGEGELLWNGKVLALKELLSTQPGNVLMVCLRSSPHNLPIHRNNDVKNVNVK